MDSLKLADRLRGRLKLSAISPEGSGLGRISSDDPAASIGQVLGGEWRYEGDATCFVVERRVRADSSHGRVKVGDMAAQLETSATCASWRSPSRTVPDPYGHRSFSSTSKPQDSPVVPARTPLSWGGGGLRKTGPSSGTNMCWRTQRRTADAREGGTQAGVGGLARELQWQVVRSTGLGNAISVSLDRLGGSEAAAHRRSPRGAAVLVKSVGGSGGRRGRATRRTELFARFARVAGARCRSGRRRARLRDSPALLRVPQFRRRASARRGTRAQSCGSAVPGRIDWTAQLMAEGPAEVPKTPVKRWPCAVCTGGPDSTGADATRLPTRWPWRGTASRRERSAIHPPSQSPRFARSRSPKAARDNIRPRRPAGDRCSECPGACASVAWREANEALAIHHGHCPGDMPGDREFAVRNLGDEPKPARHAASRHRLTRIDRKMSRMS